MELRPLPTNLDISEDTNLKVSEPVTLTDDTVGWDSTLTGNLTWGSGSDFTWTFDINGTNVTIAYTDGKVTLTGNLTVSETVTMKRLLAGGVTES